jgi:hypothetical protein
MRVYGFVEMAPGVWQRSGQVPPEKGRELMAKAPPNLPAEGDKVRCGRQLEGRLTYVNTQNN